MANFSSTNPDTTNTKKVSLEEVESHTLHSEALHENIDMYIISRTHLVRPLEDLQLFDTINQLVTLS